MESGRSVGPGSQCTEPGSTRCRLSDNSKGGGDVDSLSPRGWYPAEEATLLDVSRETSRRVKFAADDMFHVKHWTTKIITEETFHVKRRCEYLLRCFT